MHGLLGTALSASPPHHCQKRKGYQLSPASSVSPWKSPGGLEIDVSCCSLWSQSFIMGDKVTLLPGSTGSTISLLFHEEESVTLNFKARKKTQILELNS